MEDKEALKDRLICGAVSVEGVLFFIIKCVFMSVCSSRHREKQSVPRDAGFDV